MRTRKRRSHRKPSSPQAAPENVERDDDENDLDLDLDMELDDDLDIDIDDDLDEPDQDFDDASATSEQSRDRTDDEARSETREPRQGGRRRRRRSSRSNEGRKAEARTNEGRSNESRSNESRSSEGRSNEGRSNEGRSNEGRKAEARGSDARSSEARSNRGNAARSDESRSTEKPSSEDRDESRPSESGRRERSGRDESRRKGGSRTEGRSSESRPSKKPDKPVKKEMLINAAQSEECRIAILEDDVLEELYTERASQDNYVGNIYKGKIVNLEPSIQAAFVDFGVGRNGFLHISDVESQYFKQGGFSPDENFGPDGRRISAEAAKQQNQGRRRFSSRPRFKPPIQEVFQRGDEVVVQVIKEGLGNKGPTLSTYISIPGRYLVLMPALGRVGVSRKIEDEDDRRRLRDILLDLNPPKGLGFIVRTAGQKRNRRDLSRDLSYLLRLWKVIARRIETKPAPVDIYEESDMMIRTIRDILTTDVDKIYIDEPAAFERAKEFLQLVMPRFVDQMHLYTDEEPIFHKYGVEQEIANIHRREVALKGGGSIVLDQTEALVAIDVNSGSFRTDESAEETAYQLNLSAAKEIARQLRLRDLGGVIVNDFIDMRKERHRRNLEHALRDAMARDRARTKILRISPFGLIEMTRQRIRPSLKRSVFTDCPCCSGRGMVKTAESMTIEVIRTLFLASENRKVAHVTIRVNDEVAAYLNNKKRRNLAQMEEQGKMVVQILGDKGAFPEHLEMQCKDADGRDVQV